VKNVRKAIKIYERCLPSGHPNHALAFVSLANIHFGRDEINIVLQEYNHALRMQEEALLADHPDIARTLYDIDLVQIHLDHREEARQYFQRAIHIAGQTLSINHPLMHLINDSQNYAF
jgi:tetratricopeptide (TPR) repeat protein